MFPGRTRRPVSAMLRLTVIFLVLAVFAPGTVRPEPREAHPTGGGAETGPDDARLEGILKRMTSVYGELKTYRAEFHQVSETRALQRRNESGGTIYFEKPDRMRWNYRVPEPRDIYLDGKQMTVYMPERKTVVVQPLGSALADTAPARLFMGPEALRETFRIALEDPGPEGGGTLCLHLTPRKQGGLSVQKVLLWVGDRDMLPRKTESTDLLGNVTTLTFLDGKTNVKLDPETFRFQPPPDAEITENTY